jgi:hypothetical protein
MGYFPKQQELIASKGYGSWVTNKNKGSNSCSGWLRVFILPRKTISRLWRAEEIDVAVTP